MLLSSHVENCLNQGSGSLLFLGQKSVISITKFPRTPRRLSGHKVYKGEGVAPRGPSTVGWDNQSIYVLSLRHGPPHVTSSGETLCYVSNIRHPRQLDQDTIRKGKYGSFVGK
jgi:hypothetical protein